MICRICGNSQNNTEYKIREMLFGTREVFEYFQCSNCNCLQIKDFPEDLSKHYPENYLSYELKKDNSLKEYLNKKRDAVAMGNRSLIGRILLALIGVPPYVKRLRQAQIKIDDKIVDVGCGHGSLIYRMKNAGFENVVGIDPFVDSDINYENGLVIYKKSLFDLERKFDLVSLFHVLEHMEDQFEVLKKIHSLLNENKYAFIGIPIVDSYSWDKYKENWISLDAPRHFYLHSLKSINIVAEQSGFKIEKIEYDSLGTQFWGSEQYEKDIAWYEDDSYFVNPSKSAYTKKMLKMFDEKAAQANNERMGDRALFYLKRI
ncbi:MAG: class I SAM-dependent methyltransferase [Ignavibacteria bacterium]|jgi:hypothetical protein